MGNITQDDIREICTQVLCLNTDEGGLVEFCKRVQPNIVIQLEDLKQSIDAMDESTASKIIISILLLVISVLSLLGNALVVYTVTCNKHMRSSTNAFILSLAVSDITVATTCIPVNLVSTITPYWIFGSFGCKMAPYITQFFVACSSLTLCCIAFDRYCAIVHPLKLRFHQTTRTAAILLCVVWLVSAASSVPNVIYYDVTAAPLCAVSEVKTEELVYFCEWQNTDTRQSFQLWLMTTVLFLIPLLLMTIMYGISIHRLWIRKSIGCTNSKPEHTRITMKKKAIKMLLVVVLAFVLCWSPLFIMNAVSHFEGLPITMSTVHARAYLQCLALSSCCYNPIVYAFMNEKFRKVFCKFLCRRKNKINIVQTPPETNGTQCSMRTTIPQREVGTASNQCSTSYC